MTWLGMKKKFFDVLFFFLGLLLIFLGIGHVALFAIGETVTAEVYEVAQQAMVQNDASTRNPSRYTLSYRFTVEGASYSGHVTRVFEGGSQMKSTMKVRYLPFWPHVNHEDQGSVALQGLLSIGVGILVIFFAMRGKIISRVQHRRGYS